MTNTQTPILNLIEIETELKKRLNYPYQWGRKQNNYYDELTNFIYHTFPFDEVLKEIEKRFSGNPCYNNLFNYSLNRWYNFWSAQAVEKIFCSLPDIKPALDKKDRLADFTIKGITFDHKTSVFPTAYPMQLDEAIKNTGEFIEWMYRNQSQQKRKHLKNRLFIILHSSDGEHWKLKAEISWLKVKIEEYVVDFNPASLMKFEFEPGITTIADVIWAV